MPELNPIPSETLRNVLIARSAAPLMNYRETLLGRPMIHLEETTSRQAALSALVRQPKDLVIIEPLLQGENAHYLATDIFANLQSRRPPVLRVGRTGHDLQLEWPFAPHQFEVSQGVTAFNEKVVTLLALQHRRARRYVVRIHFKEKGLDAILGHSEVISTQGMRFVCGKKLAIGTVIYLEMLGATPLKGDLFAGMVLRQEVSRSSLQLYAVGFQSLSPDLKQRLEHYLADDSGGILAAPQEVV